MTPEEAQQLWPDLFGVGVKSMVDNAKRLGLTWGLRMGTVTGLNTSSSIEVQMDGDDNSITVTSIIGSQVVGARVYVISVPPAGNYIIGVANLLYPGQRIATTTRTDNSAVFTAETVLDTVTASLISGKTYKIVYYNRLFKSVADGIARFRIREDDIVGTELAITQLYTATVINQSFPTYMEVLYTATVTGDKTFVGTGSRQTGTGNLTAQAAATAPTYLYVEYVEG